MTGRNLPPFYCPYCGEDQIRPNGSDGHHGRGSSQWACELCRRVWRLTVVDGADPAPVDPAGPTSRQRRHGVAR